MKLKRLSVICTLIALVFSNSVYAEDEKSNEYVYMDRIFGHASELYLDEGITKEQILEMALDKYLSQTPGAVEEILKAGFSSLDEYTEFYTPDEYMNYVNNVNHTFYGIGVIIEKQGDYVEIKQVLEDGSAFVSGVQIGDKISKVNGIDMKGRTLDEVQSYVVGELNSSVDITFLRGEEEILITLIRRPVSSTTVSYLMLEDNIAYVSMVNFAQNTAKEFADTLVELDAQNVKKIILDLRNNPGGYLISAVEIAEMIVPEGIIVQTMYRQSENNEVFYSTLEEPKYEFVVLVNENTASSSEILTGAMQDSGIATVVGETTFGKAVIQEMFTLNSGDSFKITTGRYVTRNGREINGVGLEPDIEVLNVTEPVDITRYDELVYSSESSIGDFNDNISAIKERLSVMGYPMSDFDDTFSDELEAYVLDFQINHELTPTGKLDRITMVQIENAFAKTEVLVDNQLYKAYELLGGTKEGLDKILYSQE